MSKVLYEVLAANQIYSAEFGDRGRLPLPPARRFAILICMDARLDTAKFAGLKEGDAHVQQLLARRSIVARANVAHPDVADIKSFDNWRGGEDLNSG